MPTSLSHIRAHIVATRQQAYPAYDPATDPVILDLDRQIAALAESESDAPESDAAPRASNGRFQKKSAE